ncbi:MAG: helix-turn-helix transcriptional regulator [Dehalococcoidia bacterium]|nr:helix-turn-helix transcriptional regulator [Dehalococcoidia bacterium]
MTQREVATRAKITVATLSRIENGKAVPTVTTIRNLAAVFHLPPEEMRRVILTGQMRL